MDGHAHCHPYPPFPGLLLLEHTPHSQGAHTQLPLQCPRLKPEPSEARLDPEGSQQGNKHGWQELCLPGQRPGPGAASAARPSSLKSRWLSLPPLLPTGPHTPMGASSHPGSAGRFPCCWHQKCPGLRGVAARQLAVAEPAPRCPCRVILTEGLQLLQLNNWEQHVSKSQSWRGREGTRRWPQSGEGRDVAEPGA